MSRILLFILPWLIHSFAEPPSLIEVDQLIYEQLDQKGVSDVFVIMRDQADVTYSKTLRSKSEKGRYVFATLSEHATISQESIRRWLQNQKVSYVPFLIANGLFLRVDESLLNKLLQRDDIRSIAANPKIPLSPVNDASVLREKTLGAWGLSRVQADSVWLMGFEGEGVVIGGQDTGYEFENPAINSKYRGFQSNGSYIHDYNWHDAIHQIDSMHGDSIILPENNPCGLDAQEPCDDHNHGTHTMGTMLGETDAEIIGLAPKATWMGCRCMERGYGTPLTYLECFEWFLAPTDLNGLNPDPDMAPHVINNSWGCPPKEGCNASNFDLLDLAVENLRAAGVVVVVSAGNSGRSGCGTVDDPPGMYAGSLTIGATDINDSIAAFSSRGPVIVDGSNRAKPDLSAPGVGIRSVVRGGSFATWSGTSMAGPHVAGAVALLISAVPDLSGQVEEIENLLKRTALPLTTFETCGNIPGDQIPNLTFGYGRINIYEAVQDALAQYSSSHQKSLGNIQIYPNPGRSVLNLEWESGMDIQRIKVMDALGITREVYSNFHANRITLNTDNWNPGIYWIQLNHGNRHQTIKYIKL